MLKRIFSSITALTLMASVGNFGAVIPYNTAPITASAWQDSDGNYYTEVTYDSLTYWKYEDHVAVSDCDESAESIDIPAEIDGLPVTEIGDMAFWKHENLTKVTIPDSVTEIGWRAFGACSLTEVIIPDSVKAIYGNAFAYCSKLSEITIPESLTEISAGAFDGTKWLKNKQNENPLVIVNDVLIDGTTCEGDVTVPDGVKKISNGAFGYCLTVTSITIPDSVTSIGSSAFYDCEYLTSVTLPDSITEIESNTFAWCIRLTDITIPDSVTSIGNTAFHKCYAFTEITIPNSVVSIGKSAFSTCIALTSITLPDGITEIYDDTFSGCDSLTDINIPDSVTKIGRWAFSGCAMTEITLPENLVSIPECAFSNCYHLARITILESVEAIDTFAFYNCTSLSEINILNPNCKLGDSTYTISNNSDKNGEPSYYGVIRGYENSTAQAYAEKYGCTFEPLFSEGIYDIFRYKKYDDHVAIKGFDNLDEFPEVVDIPAEIDGLPVTEIVSLWSENLTKVTIPDGVTSIGKGAFCSCPNLEEIIIPKSVAEIGEGAFRDTKWLENKKAENPLVTVNNMIVDGTACEGDVVIPDGITSICEYAFLNCEKLTSITMPNTITKIHGSAFYECSSLTEIKLSDSITSIESYAFNDCSSLAKIEIPDSVTSIGWYAFSGCSSLTEVTIPESVALIDKGGFYNCKNLSVITILNPDCTIYDYSATIANENAMDWDGTYLGIIRGYRNSTAQKYAEKYGYTFESLGIDSKDALDSYFADCIRIDDTSWLWKSYYDNSIGYLHSYNSGAACIYITDPLYDTISFTAEGNIIEICKKIQSIDSRLYVNTSGKTGHIGSHDKRISRKTAQELYELICDDVTEFYYEFDICRYQEASYRNITGYQNVWLDVSFTDNIQIIEDYLLSQNINAVVTGDEKSIDVIPNEDITVEEHFELAKNIYDLTGLSPYGVSPSIAISPFSKGIEMKNTVKGDANGDSAVTIADATTILQALGNPDKYALSLQGEYNADVYGNNDGITPMDAIVIQQYNAHLIDSF